MSILSLPFSLSMNKPPFLPLFLTCCGFVILCFLGVWQLQRLEWKNNLQEKLDRAYAESRRLPALSFGDIKDKNFTFKRGVLNGRYVRGKNIFIHPRTYDGQVGQHMYSPFLLDGGGVVFVNRGWVPKDFSFMGDDQQYMPREKLIGLLKKAPKPNHFTPKNDLNSTQWYHPDLKAMSHIFGFTDDKTVLNHLFLLEEDGHKFTYPIKNALQIQLRNQHMQYALFWFIMAGVLGIIFILRFLKKS